LTDFEVALIVDPDTKTNRKKRFFMRSVTVLVVTKMNRNMDTNTMSVSLKEKRDSEDYFHTELIDFQPYSPSF
jgi:hypothetical protein